MPKKKNTPLKIVSQTLLNFRKDEGFTLAAALSFYAVLSMIPLTMIVVSILGQIVGHSELVLASIVRLIQESIPALTPSFIKNLSSIVQRKMTGGWAGIIVLFFVASVLFSNLEKVLDKIFTPSQKRNFLQSKLLSVLFIFIIAVLMFVPSMFKNLDQIFDFLGIPLALEFLSRGPFFFFFVAWASFVVVLALVPKYAVNLKFNCAGGLLFALLLMAAKTIFYWYTQYSLERFHLVYGSLTAIILVFMWIFYLMNLFILCAEFVGVLQSEWK